MILAIMLLQTGDGPLKLKITPVEKAATAEFTGEGSVDLPDGASFRVSVFFRDYLPVRHIGNVTCAVKDGRVGFRFAAAKFPPLAGLYIFDVQPDRHQPEGLGEAVLRELPLLNDRVSVRAGTEEEGDQAVHKIRADAAVQLRRFEQIARRLQEQYTREREGAAGADWKKLLEEADAAMRPLVMEMESQEAYRVVEISLLISGALEDIPHAVRSAGQTMALSRAGQADHARVREASDHLQRVLEVYLIQLDVDVRNAQKARTAIKAVRAAIDAGVTADGSIPPAVLAQLLEVNWQMTSRGSTVQELVTLLEHHFKGEDRRAQIDTLLSDLERSLPANP